MRLLFFTLLALAFVVYVTATFGFLKNFRLIRRGHRTHRHYYHKGHYHHKDDHHDSHYVPQHSEHAKDQIPIFESPLNDAAKEMVNVTKDGQTEKDVVSLPELEPATDGFTKGEIVDHPKKQGSQGRLFQRSRTKKTTYSTGYRTPHHHGYHDHYDHHH